jgi:hypothetical protein
MLAKFGRTDIFSQRAEEIAMDLFFFLLTPQRHVSMCGANMI